MDGEYLLLEDFQYYLLLNGSFFGSSREIVVIKELAKFLSSREEMESCFKGDTSSAGGTLKGSEKLGDAKARRAEARHFPLPNVEDRDIGKRRVRLRRRRAEVGIVQKIAQVCVRVVLRPSEKLQLLLRIKRLR